MPIEIKVLGLDDAHVLDNVAPDVFDYCIDVRATTEFLADKRFHLVVALENDLVVGFASCLDYIHPDKPKPELWINEIAVSPAYRRRCIAKAILRATFQLARELGCGEAWVLTERDNAPAMQLYASSGGEAQDQVMFSFPL